MMKDFTVRYIEYAKIVTINNNTLLKKNFDTTKIETKYES